MSQPKVLIAGAGLGGLCLAQGLKKAGIDFHVYERDQASDYRLQGYRIRIHSEGTDALQQCLPDDIYQLFEDTCAEMRLGPGSQADPLTGDILPPQPQQLGKGPPPMFRNARTVDRRVFRDVLLTGLENHVSFGKEFSHYSTNNSDAITITFSDRTSAAGTLLIGADGVHSRVRKQFLPSHIPLDTGGRIIYGKTPLSADLTSTFPPEMLKSINPTLTLLGDAAHAMPPTGASGCVTALRDAGNLVRLLVERGVKDGIKIYEEEMREYGSATIERSLEAAVKMFGFKAREEWKNVE
ncbi:putative cercosporin toxin biosynthesis protein [Botrytis fragariae]|uniref:Putative cercosporin toxin biosynthesis protein n=1 Tax=Botrytis fragariae TaxID=1964551 RepID=A0A8H6B168_9HELO|nr:putative cercosporin toxin biosynthesis protein [Botrytis fragariae]KAF5877511.1 putative cercosporin toxin biosynthesis protein [Botrytis fragariae]